MIGEQLSAHTKYALIKETLRRPNISVTLVELCKWARVSRSGYYAWLSNETKRQKREDIDLQDYLAIRGAFEFRGYKKGARSIYMRLLHLPQPVVMNLKKIRRLMKKFGLICPIRGANPYRQMARALRTSYVAENVVNRNFKKYSPRKCLLTDITYLRYSDKWCYLSVIKDVATHEILSYQLSISLKVDFVLQTIDKLIKEYGAELDNSTIVHSDQGVHYTSREFIQKLRDANFVQSMSRKGNCWDNAPQESFFGHMKDETGSEIEACSEFTEVQTIIDRWIEYYNTERYQWELDKLSPKEFYEYQTTGRYPLSIKCGLDNNFRGSAPAPEV